MELAVQLKEAISHIQERLRRIHWTIFELTETDRSIPADPAVRNFSFTNVDGKVYYRGKLKDESGGTASFDSGTCTWDD